MQFACYRKHENASCLWFLILRIHPSQYNQLTFKSTIACNPRFSWVFNPIVELKRVVTDLQSGNGFISSPNCDASAQRCPKKATKLNINPPWHRTSSSLSSCQLANISSCLLVSHVVLFRIWRIALYAIISLFSVCMRAMAHVFRDLRVLARSRKGSSQLQHCVVCKNSWKELVQGSQNHRFLMTKVPKFCIWVTQVIC